MSLKFQTVLRVIRTAKQQITTYFARQRKEEPLADRIPKKDPRIGRVMGPLTTGRIFDAHKALIYLYDLKRSRELKDLLQDKELVNAVARHLYGSNEPALREMGELAAKILMENIQSPVVIEHFIRLVEDWRDSKGCGISAANCRLAPADVRIAWFALRVE